MTPTLSTDTPGQVIGIPTVLGVPVHGKNQDIHAAFHHQYTIASAWWQQWYQWYAKTYTGTAYVVPMAGGAAPPGAQAAAVMPSAQPATGQPQDAVLAAPAPQAPPAHAPVGQPAASQAPIGVPSCDKPVASGPAQQVPVSTTPLQSSSTDDVVMHSEPPAMVTVKTEPRASASSQPAEPMKVAKAGEAKVCKNCGTDCTPFWRKDKADQLPLCNACGLYAAKNGSMRPASLWKQEKDTNNSNSSNNNTTSTSAQPAASTRAAPKAAAAQPSPAPVPVAQPVMPLQAPGLPSCQPMWATYAAVPVTSAFNLSAAGAQPTLGLGAQPMIAPIHMHTNMSKPGAPAPTMLVPQPGNEGGDDVQLPSAAELLTGAFQDNGLMAATSSQASGPPPNGQHSTHLHVSGQALGGKAASGAALHSLGAAGGAVPVNGVFPVYNGRVSSRPRGQRGSGQASTLPPLPPVDAPIPAPPVPKAAPVSAAGVQPESSVAGGAAGAALGGTVSVGSENDGLAAMDVDVEGDPELEAAAAIGANLSSDDGDMLDCHDFDADVVEGGKEVGAMGKAL